jgi:hypothetical protein
MFSNILAFAAPIVDDIPTNLDKYVRSANQYTDRLLNFVWHMITDHPNEFFTALATATVAWFTFILARSTKRLWEAGERQIRTSRQIAAIQARQTRASIREAIRAADAADRSAKVSEEAFRRLERPYLFIKVIETVSLRHPLDGQRPNFEYKLVNYGKLPAILHSVSVGLLNSPKYPLRSPMAIAEKRYEVIVPGGELLNPRTVIVADSSPGQKFDGANATGLVLYGLLQYEDPTGAFHIDSFCMRGIAGGNAFTIDGGDEYNWHKTEYRKRPHDQAEGSSA